MKQWVVPALVCLVLCGCQAFGDARTSDDSCPANIGCDEPDTDAHLLLPPPVTPAVIRAAYRPLWPGCPTMHQVMAKRHAVVFQAARSDNEPASAYDPSDWVCEPPEAPLLRAERRPNLPRRPS